MLFKKQHYRNQFLYNFILMFSSAIIQLKHGRITAKQKNLPFSGRSFGSVDQWVTKDHHIEPWFDQEFYTKTHQLRHSQKKPNKRCSTASHLTTHQKNNYKQKGSAATLELKKVNICLNSQKAARIERHTISTFKTCPTEPIQLFIQKSSQLFKMNQNKRLMKRKYESSQKQSLIEESAMTINTPNPIHIKTSFPRRTDSQNSNNKCLKNNRIQTEITKQLTSDNFNSNNCLDLADKQTLLFFFEARNNHNLVSRSKKVMKIRNLQRAKRDKLFYEMA